jgi:hypothetical protein
MAFFTDSALVILSGYRIHNIGKLRFLLLYSFEFKPAGRGRAAALMALLAPNQYLETCL